MLRKNWQSKHIHENAWGLHFDRWYIKAPSGHMYLLYRNCHFSNLIISMESSLNTDNDTKKIKRLSTSKFNEAIKEIYALEESGTYDLKISNYIANTHECINAYKKSNQKTTYSW